MGVSRGFTLLELLVVLVIISLLAAILSPQVMQALSGAKTDAAYLQIETLSNAVNRFQLDVGSYPGQEQGLEALWTRPSDAKIWRGPYIRKHKHLLDPWGNPFKYRTPGKSAFYDIYSYGADGREGGEDESADVASWHDR